MGDPQQTASAERTRTLFTVSPELQQVHIFSPGSVSTLGVDPLLHPTSNRGTCLVHLPCSTGPCSDIPAGAKTQEVLSTYMYRRSTEI